MPHHDVVQKALSVARKTVNRQLVLKRPASSSRPPRNASSRQFKSLAKILLDTASPPRMEGNRRHDTDSLTALAHLVCYGDTTWRQYFKTINRRHGGLAAVPALSIMLSTKLRVRRWRQTYVSPFSSGAKASPFSRGGDTVC